VSDLCVILDSGLQEDQIAIICREALKVCPALTSSSAIYVGLVHARARFHLLEAIPRGH
jgi:hypothetical protein